MKKLSLSFAYSLFLLLLGLIYFAKVTNASENFSVDAEVVYTINEEGITTSENSISITNTTSEVYAPSFSYKLSNIYPENISVLQGETPLDFDVVNDSDTTVIKVAFTDSIVGVGKKRNFKINYQESSFAERTGDVWEVKIPKAVDLNFYRNYSVELRVPKSFGDEAYVSPQPDDRIKNPNNIVYLFNEDKSALNGITAGFGISQTFTFSLTYHLQNTSQKRISQDIALPPDTSLQRVYIQEITPKPLDVISTVEGNWLARYNLDGKDRRDVVVKGSVQIFSTPRQTIPPTIEELESYTLPSKFWQTDNPRIENIAENLDSPRDIYNFVVGNLIYNRERATPDSTRMGAVWALDNPDNAICMEFSDLFIAIARAKGIPAREVNGFAYTENPEIQPLSLVADVLHSWVEYWDADRGVWVQVDPTWGSTAKGIDYFSNLDLRHFAFVIHGEDPNLPLPPGSYKLGDNPQKDVFVNFGKPPEERFNKAHIKASLVSNFFNNHIAVSVENPGPSALYDQKIDIYFDEALNSSIDNENLPPFSHNQYEIDLPFFLIGKNSPDNIKVKLSNQQLDIPVDKDRYLLIFLVYISIFSTAILFIFLRRIGKLRILDKMIWKLKE
ncbi:MAG: transglutaminase domain-containing protein [Candidatus Woesebacteria bacterium]|jgi:hypothetical protein